MLRRDEAMSKSSRRAKSACSVSELPGLAIPEAATIMAEAGAGLNSADMSCALHG